MWVITAPPPPSPRRLCKGDVTLTDKQIIRERRGRCYGEAERGSGKEVQRLGLVGGVKAGPRSAEESGLSGLMADLLFLILLFFLLLLLHLPPLYADYPFIPNPRHLNCFLSASQERSC